MYHKIIVLGHLGRDPQLRYTPAGSPVSSFSVASNRKDKQGNEHTTWFKISVWGSLAENCNQYLSKGRQVLVEGILNPDPATGGPRVWTANDGSSRSSYEVTASVVKFLQGGRNEADGEETEAAEATQEELPF